MARSINKQDVADGTLSWEDAMYLKQRNRLPRGYVMPDPPDGFDDEKPSPGTKVTPIEQQSVPTIGAKGGIVEDDEEEEYTDGWNNDQRRAELSKRGLSVNGRMDDMIARLRRSDTDTLLDDDYSEV
jgi:hypothetical protein